jgi:hypothetical protein
MRGLNVCQDARIPDAPRLFDDAHLNLPSKMIWMRGSRRCEGIRERCETEFPMKNRISRMRPQPFLMRASRGCPPFFEVHASLDAIGHLWMRSFSHLRERIRHPHLVDAVRISGRIPDVQPLGGGCHASGMYLASLDAMYIAGCDRIRDAPRVRM